MSWRSAMRSAQAAARRNERAVARQRRELLAQAKQMQAMREEAVARYQVALYENYVDNLISLHKECWQPWDWRQVAQNPAPPPPVMLPTHEHAACHALDTYQPSLSDKVMGAEGVRRQQLTADIDRAREQDYAAWQAALAHHQGEHSRWAWFNSVAHGVLAGKLDAYEAVIAHLSPFQELSALGTHVNIATREPWYVEAKLTIRDADVVPDEVYALTAKGKLSTKAMPKGRYYEIYQDHVASAALRIGRELLALLPIDCALVNVGAWVVSGASGHPVAETILSVAFTREAMARINFEAIDPSSALTNFAHAMEFKKTTGFRAVRELEPGAVRGGAQSERALSRRAG